MFTPMVSKSVSTSRMKDMADPSGQLSSDVTCS